MQLITREVKPRRRSALSATRGSWGFLTSSSPDKPERRTEVERSMPYRIRRACSGASGCFDEGITSFNHHSRGTPKAQPSRPRRGHTPARTTMFVHVIAYSARRCYALRSVGLYRNTERLILSTHYRYRFREVTVLGRACANDDARSWLEILQRDQRCVNMLQRSTTR